MVVNAAVAIGLAPVIGFSAAALGTTLAGWIMLYQLWRGTRPMGEAATADARLRRALPRIAAACVVMAVVLAGTARLLAGPLADPGWRYAALAALVAAGMASYALAALGFGAIRPRDVRAAMRRGKS
jgi:putative peptidoglycan lipid II flippase